MAMVPVLLTSGDTRLKLAIDDHSQTARDFLATLPRTLDMTNYDNREFYSPIGPLSEDGPQIDTFKNGDVTYYTTGQSFAIFFAKDDQSIQPDLIKIGQVTSDLDLFKQLGTAATVSLKVAG